MKFTGIALWGLAFVFLVSEVRGLSAKGSEETAAVKGEALKCGPRFHSSEHGHGMWPMKMLEELDLTEQQKSTIEDILAKYQDDISECRDAIRKATEAFFDMVPGKEFNEYEFRQAFQSVAAAEEEMAVTMARIGSEIKGILTSEQLELFKENIAARKEEISSFRSSNSLDDNDK